MLHLDWMSDEDSEPENANKCATKEAHENMVEVWRKNMLTRLGFNGNADFDDLLVLEVICPGWRSDYVSFMQY